MPKYAIHNEAGDILRTVEVHQDHIEMQLASGEFALACDANWHDRIDMETKTVIRQEPPAAPQVPQWVKARRNAYPHVMDQLDMLWHAMESGEIPKAARWFSSIKRVKDAIPKDLTAQPTVVYSVDPVPEDQQ